MSKPYVALVGRPNTGKSTFFNKLVGGRVSIVEDTPGVTRDRIILETSWCGNAFYLIDTGGIEPENNDIILMQMRRQAYLAMDMADVIVFITDAKQGITGADKEIADMIRKSNKKCILVVNKIDDWNNVYQTYDFYDLSLGVPMPLSAEHGLGFGDILDEIVENFPEDKANQEEDTLTKIAIVGKPNAGKSTLVNTLLGEERVIVSNIAGTTRDAIDTYFDYNDEKYMLIDTAGIKKKNKNYDAIEHYATVRAMKAIDRSDVCVLMIDCVEGVTEQDVKVAGLIQDAYKAVVIVMNKWDLVAKETNTMAQLKKDVLNKLYFLDYAQVLFLSAIDGKRTEKLMPIILDAVKEYQKRVTTGLLNDVIGQATVMTPAPSKKGRFLKIYYASQPMTMPPTIILSVNDSSLANEQYTRYLKNRLRDAFSFAGSPIKIIYRTKPKKD